MEIHQEVVNNAQSQQEEVKAPQNILNFSLILVEEVEQNLEESPR